MKDLKGIEIKGIHKLNSGKVREIFEVDDERLLIVTTDRISAFDVILPDAIPDKGRVLNEISGFWFKKTASIIPNHVISTRIEDYPEPLCHDERLRGRSMLVTKASPLPIECIVRGYISGSGWKEYNEKGSICGIRLKEGLEQSQRLPEPIFTPSTKAELGEHDESIDHDTAAGLIGKNLFDQVKKTSLEIYRIAAEYALGRGIIIADTKFEFGIRDGKLIIIDEMLTPDSSRFWPEAVYKPGGAQPSFDKQFVRDYLLGLDWDKSAPGPKLPEDIIAQTRMKYIEAFKKITGKDLE